MRKIITWESGRSDLYVVLVIACIILFASVLSGLTFNPKSTYTSVAEYQYTCCDTGDGEQCRAQTEKPTITFQGKRYALLKTNIHISSTYHHLDPAIPTTFSPYGERMFMNTVSTVYAGSRHAPQCNENTTVHQGYDWLYGEPVEGMNPNQILGCYLVPNEILLYACRKENPRGVCGNITGTDAKFDVYYRVQDQPIPSIIKNCLKPPIPTGRPQEVVGEPNPKGFPNLQLETFNVAEEPPVIRWLSPYCKPAIYLYPETEMLVNVKVEPQGDMLLTIPPYPKEGWNVTAYPSGDIYHNLKRFDYLYYEANIPDERIQKPTDGYVVSQSELAGLFNTLLPRLGLNQKERTQFSEYWLKVLPKRPYYFVGVIPQTNLNQIAPLTIIPQPKNTIRVTLYFKGLDEKISVNPPTFPSFSRSGFTAVEWGGILKLREGEKFSCLM